MAELEEPPHSELKSIKGNPDASSDRLYVIYLQTLTPRLGSKRQGEGENHCSFESKSWAKSEPLCIARIERHAYESE
jgi:hypothetical protein